MSQLQNIQIQLEGISALLKTRRFKIPAYQRSYAWEQEQVEALLNDISGAIHDKESEYFLGSIVVTGPNNNRFEVVDGQQRLTTASLLIAVIRDIFRDKGDEDVATQINSDFLANTDRRTKEKEPKLILNDVDNELYQELVDDTRKSPPKLPSTSHKRIMQATQAMRGYMLELCAKSGDDEELLHDWLDYLQDNLKVILVMAPDESNAFVIFETLNDRGLELAISDLLKNYLFHKSMDKIEETKNRWLSTVAVLEAASEEPLIVTCLRHFTMAKYGLVREKELFGFIKRKVTSKRTALQFSSDLHEAAKTYSALINTEHEFWDNYPASVKENVKTLNLLGMTQIRPLLLAVLGKFDSASVSRAFEKLVAIAVRQQIVGGAGGGTLERMYSETAKGVTEGVYSTPAEIVKAFTSLPADPTFEQEFAVATISKQKLARYYLRSLEMEAGKTTSFVPNSDTDKVNLEHVLPKTLSEEWKKTWEAEDARAYLNRLGNLAIMSTKTNSHVGNDDFNSKKKAYATSEFALTKPLADVQVWDKQAVDARQKEMAKLAVKIWAIK